MPRAPSRTAAIFVKLPHVMLLFILGACQTSRYKEFETIHGGMSKSEVLNAIGGPTRTQRWHGRDRWEYTLNGTPEGDITREVHFENGRSTYVGAAIKPPISADEQDQINLLSNQAADVRESEEASLARQGLTIQKFHSIDDATDSVEKSPTAK